MTRDLMSLVSWTQYFPKLVRHLDKSKHLILLSQSDSQCLACQAKMLTPRKLKKAQQVTLKEWTLLLLKEAFISAFGNSLAWCLGQMRPSPIYRHQWNSLEPQRVPYNSRIFQNTLHHSMYKPMYKHIQETSRILQKALDSSHAFHHSVEFCGLFQASREPSTLFPLMAKCRSLQKLPGLYINPWGDSFETSCDTLPHLSRRRPRRAFCSELLNLLLELPQCISWLPTSLILWQSLPFH